MAFSLIDYIDYAIRGSENYELKIGLRTLKVFILLWKSELKVEQMNLKLSILSTKWNGYDEHSKPSSLLLLCLRIQDLLRRNGVGSKMLRDIVQSLGKEVDSAILNRMSQSSLLTLEEIFKSAHATAESSVDWLELLMKRGAGTSSNDSLQVIDTFRMNMVIIRNILHFVVMAGVELENLLFHIKPIVINAARVFIKHDASNWCRDVESYCLAVNNMAADHQIYQAYSQTLAAASTVLLVTPSHVDHGVLKNFMNSIISILWDVLRLQSHFDSRSRHQFKMMYERLRFCRGILKKNAKDEKIEDQIKVLACDAGVFIYSHYLPDPERLSGLLQRFDVLQAQVKEELIVGEIPNMKIYDGGDRKDLDIPTPIWNHQHPQCSITSIVGFHLEEVTSVLDRLTRGSKQLRIVQISGMAGIGKTTFALQLYNHACVVHHFHACAWYAISQVFDKKEVLLQLLNQVYESENHSKMNEDDLANRLRQSLKGKRYLIMLDDVCVDHAF